MTHTLLITGFHRSGTSLTANLLQNAGLFLGDELLDANASNPYGHFEDRSVLKFHDRLLARRGLKWQVARPFLPCLTEADWQWMKDFVMQRRTRRMWGFKDPRLCLFVKLWKIVAPESRFLYVYRPIEECIYSIKKRSANNVFANRGVKVEIEFWRDQNLAAAMYNCYAEMFLRATEAFKSDVAIVSHKAIVDGFDLGEALYRLWDIPFEDATIADIYDAEVVSNGSFIHILDEATRAKSDALRVELESRLLENQVG